jgi:hypothetical protein
MSALIGTRHVSLGEGFFLSTASCNILTERSTGKPVTSQDSKGPQKPIDNGNFAGDMFTRAMASYKRRLAAFELRKKRMAGEDIEFAEAQFRIATTQLADSKYFAERVMLEVHSRKGEEFLVDVVTGVFFDRATGRCKSSEMLHVIASRECTLEERKAAAINRRAESGFGLDD